MDWNIEGKPMTEHTDIAPDSDSLRAKLEHLMTEHRDLDSAITALQDSAHINMMQLQRMKKRKLRLKDQISRLESMLVPDIIA